MLRQPEPFLWPTPEVARRVRRAVDETEAEVVLFGATYPLALLGPRLAAGRHARTWPPRTGSSTGCRSRPGRTR